MPGSVITMSIMNDIFNKAKTCDSHVQKFEECVLDKNNTFEECYVVHMNQFHSCVRKLNII